MTKIDSGMISGRGPGVKDSSDLSTAEKCQEREYIEYPAHLLRAVCVQPMAVQVGLEGADGIE